MAMAYDKKNKLVRKFSYLLAIFMKLCLGADNIADFGLIALDHPWAGDDLSFKIDERDQTI